MSKNTAAVKNKVMLWVLIIAVSVIFILLGIILILLGKNDSQGILYQIGLAIIVLGISSITLNVFVGYVLSYQSTHTITTSMDKSSNEISKSMDKSSKDIAASIRTLEKAVNIYQGSQTVHLLNLYSDRAKAMEAMLGIINRWVPPKFDPAKEEMDDAIYMIGISLRDMFHYGRQTFSGGSHNTMSKSIETLLDSAKNKGWTPKDSIIRTLVMNPLGYQAILRMFREELEDEEERQIYLKLDKLELDKQNTGIFNCLDSRYFQRASMYVEVAKTFQRVQTLREKKLPIDVRGYLASSSCFVVLIPGESLFIEQYHYGTPRDRVSGGQSPVLEFSYEAPIYHQIRAHAEFLWKISSDQNYDTLNTILEDVEHCTRIWEKLKHCRSLWDKELCKGYEGVKNNTSTKEDKT